MASLEKLSKALEALKNTIPSAPPPEEIGNRSKEKASLCILVADTICSSETKVAQNFNNHLSNAMEILFQLCDDQDSNVRMVADECLNRIIRCLMDGHTAKVNVELHSEIRKNRNARSLRAALMKFAELAHTIRPTKRKVYMHNLVDCIIQIAKRPEESVLETLATSLGRFLVPLGCFLSDSEVKKLLQVFMVNIGSENAVFRRTAVSSILAVCLNCGKSQFFIVHTINTLLESVIPVKDDQNIYTILGVLNCIRGLLGHLDVQGTETGLRGSFGLKRKQKKETVLSVDSIIQVFELCLYWTQHEDHNVATAALETLNELITSPPPQLVPILLNQQGLTRSRIHSANIGWKLSTKTLSDISVATSAVTHSEDMSFLEPEDLHPPLANLSNWLEGSNISVSQTSIFEKSGPASINQDSIQDYPDSESVMSDDFGMSFSKPLTSQTPEHDLEYHRYSPSPPLDSFHPMVWDIGEITDCNQSPLLFAGRRLVTAFLIPECGSVRVSVRSLALTCLSQILRLSPSIFFHPVDKNGLSTPKGFSHICDIVCFANHSDQQLRGLTRLLIGHLIHSLFSHANFGPQFTQDFLEKNVSLEELINILISGIQDESSVCVRHSLSGLVLCLPDIMDSRHYILADIILDKLLFVAKNPYWLVKVKLVELLCSLPFQSVYFIKRNSNYQSKLLNLLIEEFLANEDSRVRKTTCECIVKIVKNLHFPIDYGMDDVVVARGISLTSRMFSDISKDSDKFSNNEITENCLSRVVNILVEALALASSKHLSFGCIEALCTLSEVYPPSHYPLSWQCCAHQVNETSFAGGGLFYIIVTFLTRSPISLDLECHQWLLKLASNLFVALSAYQSKEEKATNDQTKLKTGIDELLTHVMRLMYIFVRVMEDSAPARTLLASPLKKRPARALSPSKTQINTEKEAEKDIKVRTIGVFGNVHHCQKLLETVRSGYTNYKLTLDNAASEKFLSLIRHTLGCLEIMLSPNNVIDSESIFEELLQYLRVSFVLDGEGTVKVVYQLLRSLFETNLLGMKMNTKQAIPSLSEKTLVNGFYKNIFYNPLVYMFKQCNIPSCSTQQSHEDHDEKERTPLSQSERDTLASRIKLFEGVVIQSLKEYTLTCNIRLQAQVLRLLTLLVQLKVNYCLLDSDQVFIQFVLNQFEFLEAGKIHEAEVLIPSIFQFLVHLSNEKNHSKPVISMPKIIQLCDGLMASGQNPITHSIPALIPVVEHVFYRSSSAADQKEVETQKEVLLAMLLRLAEYPQVLEIIYNLMSDGWKWEEHWPRWYKQTIDSILPLLADGRIVSSDMSSLHALLCLNKTYVAPLPSVLILLFSPQQEGQTLSQWLGMVTIMLLSISIYDEKKVYAQLEQMNLYVREEGDDPLKVNTVSKTLPPQSLLAKLVFRIISTSASKLKSLIQSSYKDEPVTDLEKSFSKFLLCCVLILQPGRFTQVSNSLSALMRNTSDLISLEESFKVIGECCHIPVLLWLQVIFLLDNNIQKSWFSSIVSPKRVSLNEILVRRGAIMLYAEYLSKRPQDLDGLRWFFENFIEDVIRHCHEPPIEELLSSIYNLVPNSKILLESSASCIKIREPVFTHRLLNTLEYIHTDFSGAVLKLVSLSLIDYTNIAIARLAAAFCCRTVEYILTSDNPTIKKQLTEDELRHIFNCLSLNQRQFKRHSNLIILLNKLGKQNYNISLCEFDGCVKPVSADFVKSTELNKSWFISLVKDKCSNGSDCDTRKCAYLLSKLDYEDAERIMTSKEFDLNILEHCFSSDVETSPEAIENSQDISQSKYPVFNCAKKILLKTVKEICDRLPERTEIFDQNESINYELFQFLSSKDSVDMILSVLPALKNLLYSLEKGTASNDKLFDKNDSVALTRFGVLCVEVINWIVFQMPRHELMHWPSIVQSLLECSAAVLQIDSLSSSLSFEDISSICTSLMSLFKFVMGQDVILKEYKPISNEEGGTTDTTIVIKTALQMTSIISWIENGSENIPSFIYHSSKSIIVSLARNQKLNWLCRIPIEAWQPPLDSPTPPTIPIHLLHDVEILNQIVSRIHLLGWRGKFQFEESWVCLLGALSPNPDLDNSQQEEMSVIMLANSLAIDGITWLVMSTLCYNKSSSNDMTYLHVPRHSNEKFASLKCWKRLAEMNDILCSKLKRISGDTGIRLLRIDQRPNIERVDCINRYGFAQMSVSYLLSQMKPGDDSEVPEEAKEEFTDYVDKRHWLVDNGVDIRSCVQFILDQWVLPNSGLSWNLQLSMIKSILCISDMFNEQNHFEWMLNTFLDVTKSHQSDDEIIHQYLIIGISKACAVLNAFEGERGESILKIIESSLKSSFRPTREASIHSILYLLQGLLKIENSVEEGDIQRFKSQDFRHKILQLSMDLIRNHFQNGSPESSNDSLLVIALTFYLLEFYQKELTDTQEILKSLISIVKTSGNGMVYRSVLHGFERLILIGDYDLNDQITRLALDRLSQPDPNVTIPALQLLLACIYSEPRNDEDGNGESEPWTIEIMEKITALFDKIKKGYPIEVEIVCDILPGILSDFFSASDILTKVIGEFLSPNQPHKRNMAAMVFQVFTQACSEQQLPLLQDWVVYSLNNLTHNLPIMMAGWSLCCFFISASINPWLKAIFPLIQSRIRQCEYEDRQILCLAAVDFYSQLNSKQKEIFVESLKNTTPCQESPFTDIIACL